MLASIQKIEKIYPIDGADRIERVKVLEYMSIAGKGEFAEGEEVIFIATDTLLPVAFWSELFRPKTDDDLVEGKIRLKRFKVRGAVSEGIVLKKDVLLKLICASNVPFTPENEFTFLSGYPLGTDVSDILDVTKYNKPEQKCIGVDFPTFLYKTDEPNLKGIARAIEEFYGKEAYVSVKYDGTSASYYLKNGKFGVCSRNSEIVKDGDNWYWEIARKYNLESIFRGIGDNICIQGEICGPGIQGNKVGLNDLQFYAFDGFHIEQQKYLGLQFLLDFNQTTGIPIVQVIWKGIFNFTLDELVEMAETTFYGNNKQAEGIVVRPVEDCYSETLKRRLSVKITNYD